MSEHHGQDKPHSLVNTFQEEKKLQSSNKSLRLCLMDYFVWIFINLTSRRLCCSGSELHQKCSSHWEEQIGTPQLHFLLNLLSKFLGGHNNLALW